MNHCLWCDEEIKGNASWREVFFLAGRDILCASCRGGLEFLAEPLCGVCGRSLEGLDEGYRHGDVCYDCVRWEEGPWRGIFVKNRSLCRYNSFLREIIARYKFRGDAVMVKGIRREWEQLYERDFAGMVAVPIPLSKERLYERGFNQAFELANLLPVNVCEVLERPAHEQKQSKKTRKERLNLGVPVFRLHGKPSEIEGENVVLVDDIYTTGATVRQAAKVLLKGGAASVHSITLARG
ncbi:MAG TPA: ComF family protein [Bacillales bacterium]|nr:ComF family protein [Bacillales bacterium]